MKRELRLWLMLCPIVVALAGCASQPTFHAFSPDWQNPNHARVRETLVSLLRAAGRDPMGCSIFFFETKNLAVDSLSNCMFGVSDGLASTGDERLIRGIQSIAVAHDVLGHADKREAAFEAAEERGAVIGVILWGKPILPGRSLLLPPYSPSQQAEAEKEAAELLRTAGDPDPEGTLLHASVRRRDAGVVEPWPAPEPTNTWGPKVVTAVTPLAPGSERPIYTLWQKWSRSDGDYKLTKIDTDLYVFSAGPDQEIHLTKDLMVARAKKGGWVTEFDSLPKLWPLVVGKSGSETGNWQVPMDPMRLPVKYTWRVEAYEEVRVPAGTFKAFRIALQWEPQVTDTGRTSNYPRRKLVTWYAPEVGQLVKADFGQPGPLTFQVIAVDRPGTTPKDK